MTNLELSPTCEDVWSLASYKESREANDAHVSLYVLPHKKWQLPIQAANLGVILLFSSTPCLYPVLPQHEQKRLPILIQDFHFILTHMQPLVNPQNLF